MFGFTRQKMVSKLVVYVLSKQVAKSRMFLASR